VYGAGAEELFDEVKGRIRKLARAGMHMEMAQNRVKDVVSQFFYERTKRRPMVLPMVIEV
ncbi:MAG: ribonuclease J, partial [Chloroflexi bacterium]|nr:ribonuclease J [Chloroflexota bacterium]